jgi:hypothetical protein
MRADRMISSAFRGISTGFGCRLREPMTRTTPSRPLQYATEPLVVSGTPRWEVYRLLLRPNGPHPRANTILRRLRGPALLDDLHEIPGRGI